MRGDSENVNMSPKTIANAIKLYKDVFWNISTTPHLVLSGGEPTLVANISATAVALFSSNFRKDTKIEMITNGTVWNEEVQFLVNSILCLSENHFIRVSSDKYHREQGSVHETWRELIDTIKNVYIDEADDFVIIKQGRADNFGDRIPTGGSGEMLYVNVFGDVIPGINFSYKTQEEKKICNVNDYFAEGKFLNFIRDKEEKVRRESSSTTLTQKVERCTLLEEDATSIEPKMMLRKKPPLSF